MATSMDFKGVRERARIHDRETSSHGAGRQQRVLLDHRLFASNPTLPGASASDPLGHLFVSILLALVPSFEMKLWKKFGIWQFFSEYLQKNLEFQLKKNNNVLKFPVLFFVTWFCFFKAMEKTQTIPAIFQFFLFFSFSFPGAPHKKPCQVIQSQKFPIWCQIFTPVTTLFPSFHWFFSMVPRTCTKGVTVYGRLLKMKKSNSEHGCWKPQSTLLEEGSGQGQVSRRRQQPWPIRGTYDETCSKR